MPAPGKGVGFWVRGLEPLDDPAWAWVGPAGKKAFWRHVARLARDTFDDERRRGIDRFGKPLIPLAEKTREHRRSAMGHADPDAPVFLPAHEASRTISFLMTDVTEQGVWCRWKHDPRVRTSWGTILRYHAEGKTASGKVRDVVGISPAGMTDIRQGAASWWQANRKQLVMRSSGGRVVATSRGVMVTAPAGPAAVVPAARGQARSDRQADWFARFDAARARGSSFVASNQSAHRDIMIGSDHPFVPQAPGDFMTPWGRRRRWVPPSSPVPPTAGRLPVPGPPLPSTPPGPPARPEPARKPPAAPVRLGPSRAQVEALVGDGARELEAGRALFGPRFRMADYASLVGAPDHATVRVLYDEREDEVGISVSFPEATRMDRSVKRDARGKIVIHNEVFHLEPDSRGAGLGTRIFTRQVENAARLGVDRIEAEALRAPDRNGYFTWARLGFDGPIPTHVRALLRDSGLPASLRQATRVRQLMRTEAGRDWWKEHGDTFEAVFDLKPGSLSRRRLAAYLRDRAGRSAPSLQPVRRSIGAIRHPQARKIRAAMDLIDHVHQAPSLGPVPILKDATLDSTGSYDVRENGQPWRIRLRPDLDQPGLATLHEVAHMLGSEIDHAARRDARVQAWLDAWARVAGKSQAIQSLQSLKNRLESLDPNGYADTIGDLIYLMEPVESWARAYAQYIATRTADPALLKELADLLKRLDDPYHPHVAQQWDPADFEPIARTIDDLLDTLGWRNVQ